MKFEAEVGIKIAVFALMPTSLFLLLVSCSLWNHKQGVSYGLLVLLVMDNNAIESVKDARCDDPCRDTTVTAHCIVTTRA